MSDDSLSDLISECSEASFLSDFYDECNSCNYDLSNGSPIDTDNFNIVHFNINSILAPGKLDQLSHYSKLLKVDVLIITESKLDQTIPTNLIIIPGYHEPIRQDRHNNGRYGGGVLMYINENLTFQQKQNFQSPNFEHIWADVKINGQIFAINALYRPPNESQADHDLFLNTAEDILEKLSNYDAARYKIISSDLNFGNCYCKFPILDPKPLDTIAPDLFSNYGFSQLIDIPTRTTETTLSLIDLFFINNIENIICHGTLPKIADHDGIIVSFNCKSVKPPQKMKTIYDYKSADIEGLNDYIKNFDFENTVFNQPIINQTDIYSDILKQAFSKFVPCKTVAIRAADMAWCNTFTRLLLRKKNRNYHIFKKCNCEYQNALNDTNAGPDLVTRLLNRKNKAFAKARQAANDSCKANRRAKAVFSNTVNNTLKNPSLPAKRKFAILLKLMKNNKFSSIPPLIENDLTVQDPIQKSNIFNEFFASKSSVKNSEDPIPILEKKQGVPPLNVLNTSPIEVAKFARHIKKSQFSECGIPGKFINLISTPISFSMSRLFNNLFEVGHFPHLWKLAHVTAIYKKSGPKTDKSSFRPISILPTLSKLCESVIHERLLRHCIENNVISEKQAAYLKGDSTISQLLYIVHKIKLSWGQKNLTHGLFLDVSSAFDKVWHNGLLGKLGQIGVEGSFYDMLKSYLTDRRQVVVVNGHKSEMVQIKAGVPQGSRLGPLLFIIYMNDIINNIESDILIFADDTSLFASGSDPVLTVEQLNRDLQKISNWSKKWKVSFNAKKSKDIIFSNKYLNNSPPLVFNGNFIERVNSHKHLGVYLSSTLDWSVQLNEVCLRANRKLSVLRSVKILNRQTLDLLYKITVRSVIDYALPVYYNNLTQKQKMRLEQIQYRAAKLVTGALHLTSKDKLNTELGWETIKKRSEILGLNIFHKIHRYETRPLIRSCMPKINYERENNLRSKGSYIPFKSSGSNFSLSFFPYHTKLWNSLKKNIKALNITDFKNYTNTMKPTRYKHFQKGNKYTNSLLTRIRVGRSQLNQHTFSLGQIDSPECMCHHREESPMHYFLDCFLYLQERQAMLQLFEHYIPNFNLFSKKQKLQVILNGINPDIEEFIRTNITLTIGVQNFILQTKRF